MSQDQGHHGFLHLFPKDGCYVLEVSIRSCSYIIYLFVLRYFLFDLISKIQIGDCIARESCGYPKSTLPFAGSPHL